MPEIDINTELIDIAFVKFVRTGRRIVYDSPLKDHSQIARENGMQRSVDDGGFIESVDFRDCPVTRIKFTLTTQTCYLNGDPAAARAETVKTAKEILGEHKVC